MATLCHRDGRSIKPGSVLNMGDTNANKVHRQIPALSLINVNAFISTFCIHFLFT